MSEVVERVVELFDSTCIKQFESMDCEIICIENLEFAPEDVVTHAFIECHSDDMQLMLAISATKNFLVRTMPVIGDQESETDVFQKDWCLELANRFLGRLKNKLLSHGCTLGMGIPSLSEVKPEPNSVLSEGSTVIKDFQIKDADEHNLIRCTLSVGLLTPDMELEDHEDEDEDWFDESELHHL